MTMQKQPEDLHRVRRGEVKYKDTPEEDGTVKALPADAYDIFTKDKALIGHTRRAAKGKGWYAVGVDGQSLKLTAEGLWEPYRTHGEAMAALGSVQPFQAPPEPEPVRSDEPTVTEEESITVIMVEEPVVEDYVSPSVVLTPQQAADLHTQLSEELEYPQAGDFFEVPPPAAPEQSQAAVMAETDDWLAASAAQQLPAGGDDVFVDPFAPPQEDDRHPVL